MMEQAVRSGKTWAVFTTTERILLAIGSLVAILAMLGIGKMMDIPREPAFNGSLLAGSSPVVSIIVTGIAIVVCMVIGSLVAAFIEEEAGLLCATIGLAAFAVRCGPIRPVFQSAKGPAVLLAMAFESILLGAFLITGWWALSQLFLKVRSRQLPAIAAAAPNEIEHATLSQRLTVTGVQVLVMGLLEQLLIQTDVKAQALAGVGIAAFVGVLVAYMFVPLPSGIWYWIGPTLLAVIGYLLAFLSPDGLNAGEIHGWASAMARPTPLDYAGMGTAGALIGYWASRRWAQPEESETADEPVAA